MRSAARNPIAAVLCMWSALAALAVLFPPVSQATQTLDLPPRSPSDRGGSAIGIAIQSLDLQSREEVIYEQVARGNVPRWLRRLVRVEMRTQIDDNEHIVTLWVTPDYLSVGDEGDYLRMPLSPQTAMRIANLTDAALPTPRIADAIWKAASVQLSPRPIPPSPAMTTVPVFMEHNRMIGATLDSIGAVPGVFVAGNKKDVVSTPWLDSLSGKVAVYGWHRQDGNPIQPLYTGHSDRWVDYSHGVRLVSRRILIDGEPHDLAVVLRTPGLAELLGGVAETKNGESPVGP